MDANAFARLVDGDEAVLDQAYLEWSSYVTSWLVHKEKAPTAAAEDLFADALLRFREKVRDGSIESFDNPRAYVLKTAIRMWHARCNQQASLTRRHQMYYAKHFEDDYVEGNIPYTEGKSKYNTTFSYHKKAENRNFSISNIAVNQDTIINNERLLNFTITPTRKINRYEFINNENITLKNLKVNGAFYDDGKKFVADVGTLLIYQMANSDKDLTVSFTIDKNVKPNLTLNEISYDLLSNRKFDLKPRSEIMMPMPFVVNDAIIC